jgi:hypothetical protein
MADENSVSPITNPARSPLRVLQQQSEEPDRFKMKSATTPLKSVSPFPERSMETPKQQISAGAALNQSLTPIFDKTMQELPLSPIAIGNFSPINEEDSMEIDDLESKYATLISSLHEEVLQLQGRFQQDLSATQTETIELKVLNASLENERSQLAERVTLLEADLQKATEIMTAKDQDHLARLQGIYANEISLAEKDEMIAAELRELRKENEDLKFQMESNEKDYETLKFEFEEIKECLEQERASSENLKASLEARNAEFLAIGSDQASVYASLDQSKAEIAHLQQQLLTSQASYEEQIKAMHLQLEVAAMKSAEFETAISSMELTIDQLAQANKAAIEKKIESEEGMQKFEEDKQELLACLQSVEAENANLYSQMEESKRKFEAAQLQISQLKTSLEDANAEYLESENKKNVFSSSLSSLKQQHAEIQEIHSKLCRSHEFLSVENDRLKEELSKTREEMKKICNENSNSGEMYKENLKLRMEIKELNARFKETVSDLEQARKSLSMSPVGGERRSITGADLRKLQLESMDLRMKIMENRKQSSLQLEPPSTGIKNNMNGNLGGFSPPSVSQGSSRKRAREGEECKQQ